MKIGILTAYYTPEITAETHLLLDLANDFTKNGIEVTVVTSFPSRGIDERTRQKYHHIPQETTNGVRIHRVGLKIKEGKNFILRTFYYLILSFSIYLKAKKIKPDVYLISSTPPFLGIVGVLLSKTAPTVYNLQDLFPDSLININKRMENSFIIKLFRKVERLVYLKNTHLLTISENFKENILSRGVPDEKISIVYNWIDTDIVRPINRKENKLISRYNLQSDLFYVTYCGNIGYSQNLEMVIDVAKRMESTFLDLRFIFLGDGAWLNNIKEYINKTNTKNVTLLPYQLYEDISHVYSLGDVSIVCSKKGAGKGLLPSKTWSIMSAARAVLCSFDEDSELCKIINRADCGLCVPPEDSNEFEKSLMILYTHKNIAIQYGANGREYILKNLTREQGTTAYLNILKRFAKHNIDSV